MEGLRKTAYLPDCDFRPVSVGDLDGAGDVSGFCVSGTRERYPTGRSTIRAHE